MGYNCSRQLLTLALPVAALRFRDLKAGASDFSSKFLAREVDYARSSTTVYARVLMRCSGRPAAGRPC